MTHPITEADLYCYLAGRCDDDLRCRIATQREIQGSPIQQWFEQLDRRLASPFEIDWAELSLLATDDDPEAIHENVIVEASRQPAVHAPPDAPPPSPAGRSTQTPRTSTSRWALRVAIAASILVIAGGLVWWVVSSRDPVVAQVMDPKGRVVMLASGRIRGLDRFPERSRDEIEQMIRTRAAPVPAETIARLSRTNVKRGSSMYQSPVGTLVKSTTPTLKWLPVRAPGKNIAYRVTVYDPVGTDVTNADVASTEWTVSIGLQRGKTYAWEVDVLFDGAELTNNEAKPLFRIIETPTLSDVAQMERESQGSSLALAAGYASFGLIDDARTQLLDLLRENPKSDLVEALLQSIHENHRVDK